jgi:hypothetical protein
MKCVLWALFARDKGSQTVNSQIISRNLCITALKYGLQYSQCFSFIATDISESLLLPYSGYKRSHFYPEDGGSRFIQNAGNYLPDYMASHPRNNNINSQ